MASLCGKNTHQILDLKNVSQKAFLDFFLMFLLHIFHTKRKLRLNLTTTITAVSEVLYKVCKLNFIYIK